VRINDAQAAIAMYVLQGQAFEEVRLSRARSTDRVEVGQPILLPDSEDAIRQAVIGPAEV
jgi:hypothetical protein